VSVPSASGLIEPRGRDGDRVGRVSSGSDIPADGVVQRAASLSGELRLPSDKSVAHRALIANAASGGPASVTVRAPGADVVSTVRCLRGLGVSVVETATDDGAVVFTVSGEPGAASSASLDGSGGSLHCGNSGTTMRLLAGLLAGLPIAAIFDGDESLRRRPMARLAEPLHAMGATVETTDGHAPLRVVGTRWLRALEHRLPVASAQLLGAICLAALSAAGETRVIVPGPSRDHTERLLAWMGVPIERHSLPGSNATGPSGTMTTIRGPARPAARSLTVPGDPSAATPWLVAAAIHPDAELRLVDVGLNPSRLAAIGVLREMGADIEVVEGEKTAGLEAECPEPVGDIVARSAGRLHGVHLRGDRVAELIDELHALAVAMAAAEGTSELRDAAELRVKESDRIAAVVAGLAAIGADVEELPDGWRLRSGSLRGAAQPAAITTRGDHRIAIAFAVAALAGVAGKVRLDDPSCVAVSYPTFWADVARVTRAAEGAPR
jgi:3-phosphoshikimate 1-carboxyvinyltransferase